MACDIRKIVDKLHAVIDTSVKGSAMAITQKDDGNFSVIWGDSFRIKTRAQAVHAAEQKVNTAHKKADEAGFNHKIFGPYLAVDTSPENEIVIKKLPTTKLERALEIRNEALDKEKAISEIMSEQDKEFFDAQRADTEILNEQNDNKDIDEVSYEGLGDIFQDNSELASIGTQQQYSKYLSTIFPDSKVKDIVYHGTKAEFENFSKDYLGKNLGQISKDSNLGFFFGVQKEAKGYGIVFSGEKGKQRIIPTILNIIKPRIITSEAYVDLANKDADNRGVARRIEPKSFESKLVFPIIQSAKTSNQYDGVIFEDIIDYSRGNQQIVFEPEQIHILGSKQDIEGFKKFVNKNTSTSDIDVASLKEGIKSDMFRKMFEDNPQEFLKFVAEQFYGVANGQFTNTEAPTDALVSSFGEKVLEAAFEAYPLESLLTPEGLPAIYPSC